MADERRVIGQICTTARYECSTHLTHTHVSSGINARTGLYNFCHLRSLRRKNTLELCNEPANRKKKKCRRTELANRPFVENN